MSEEKSFDELLPLITHPKKRAFLENYPTLLITRDTCQAIGIGKTTFYRWLNEDSILRDAWNVLKKEVAAHRLEEAEGEAHRRGMAKSDLLLLAELNYLTGGKWSPKTASATFVGDTTILFAFPPAPYEQIVEGEVLKELENATEQEERQG